MKRASTASSSSSAGSSISASGSELYREFPEDATALTEGAAIKFTEKGVPNVYPGPLGYAAFHRPRDAPISLGGSRRRDDDRTSKRGSFSKAGCSEQDRGKESDVRNCIMGEPLRLLGISGWQRWAKLKSHR